MSILPSHSHSATHLGDRQEETSMIQALMILACVAQKTTPFKSAIYVGSIPCPTVIRKTLAEAAPEDWKAQCDKLGLTLRENLDTVTVWSDQDPLIAGQRKLAQFFDSVRSSLKGKEDWDVVRLSSLPAELRQGLADSMPYALKPIDDGSFSITPAFTVNARNRGNTYSANFTNNAKEPPVGFELGQEARTEPRVGFLGSLNKESYTRSIEVLAGKKDASESATRALTQFDREVEISESLAKQNLYRLFDQLLASANLSEEGRKSGLAKKFSELPDAIQKGLGGDLAGKWRVLGFKSAAEAEQFFTESDSISVMPMLRIGIRFQNPDGTSTTGYYNLAGPPRAGS